MSVIYINGIQVLPNTMFDIPTHTEDEVQTPSPSENDGTSEA